MIPNTIIADLTTPESMMTYVEEVCKNGGGNGSFTITEDHNGNKIEPFDINLSIEFTKDGESGMNVCDTTLMPARAVIRNPLIPKIRIFLMKFAELHNHKIII